jgi:heme/copper-type cytochrome/quinol oxidase subunit 2
MRGGVEVQSSKDYDKWISEQETFKDLIVKQQKIEFENKKIVKNNNFLLNKEIYKEE